MPDRRALLALVSLTLALGSLAPAQSLVVGSKNFPESAILGEIFTLLLEEHTELQVEHVSGLAGTLVAFTALTSGEIDLYPEYTGTGWSVILEHTEPASDPMRTFFEVATRFHARWDLSWLAPLGFDNTYAIAVREDLAEDLGLRSLSDLAPHAAELRGGFSSEFMERADGYPGLAERYGFELGEARGMEHGLTYAAIASGELDLIDVYATDGRLLRYRLHLLDDDRGYFPPYQAAPLVRDETLRAHPEVRAVLERLAYRLDGATMTRLNYEVEVVRRAPREVAREFLAAEGLLAAAPEIGAARSGEGFLAFFLGRWRTTLRLTLEHIGLTLAAVALAIAVAVPLGVWIQRHPIAERLALGGAGVVQTIPSLALLAFAITVPGLGLSVRSAILALFLYAVLPILRNTHAGLRGVDPVLVEAARAIGLTPTQILLRVRLPLATGTILAGVRTSTVVAVGVATLAAFIGAGGLGEPIVTGLSLNDRDLILAGALPAALLALAADGGLGLVERRLIPRGLRKA